MIVCLSQQIKNKLKLNLFKLNKIVAQVSLPYKDIHKSLSLSGRYISF